MSDDLVERLRLVGRTFMPELMHGSANEIERLRAERDALRVRLRDIDDEGIHYTTGKTGVPLVITWTPELRACVDEASKL